MGKALGFDVLRGVDLPLVDRAAGGTGPAPALAADGHPPRGAGRTEGRSLIHNRRRRRAVTVVAGGVGVAWVVV